MPLTVNLFLYGTLEFPRIFARVTGRSLRGEPAELAGFRRYAVVDGAYPGIVPETGATVAGTLVRGVSLRTLQRLDRYEGRRYLREAVQVQTGSAPAQAEVYVIRAGQRHILSNREWQPAHFARHHLAHYLHHLDADA